MTNEPNHIPGRPKDPTPPSELQHAADTITHDAIAQVGLTTTSEGEWALLVRVKPEASYPIPEVEQLAHGHPVIYQRAPARTPVARPAFPSLGE